jgi:hypothetical protein
MHLEEGNYTVVELRIQEKLKEATKSARESMGVRPQARAQSNNKPKKSSTSLMVDSSTSSKVRRLRSRQTVHIRHNGTKFQVAETCLPQLLYHPKRRSTMRFGNTQQTPKEQSTAYHKSEAKAQ